MPSRPLSPDRATEVRLHTWAGTHASKVVKRTMTRRAAVAVLSLVAPCRPDQVRVVIERVGSTGPAAADWPPRSVQLELLAAAEQVTAGAVALTGPGGVTVQHVTYTDRLGYERRVLRVHRAGALVGDYPTVAALARQVDVTTLEADPAG